MDSGYYPIPRCDDAVEDIDALARWFISVDMDSGYWQIPADPETREKLAFYTPNGKKHWTVMPMGALNWAPVFVAMMESLKQEWNKLAIEADIQHSGTKVIIDDVLVYGCEFDELVKYFKIVLSVLKKYRAITATDLLALRKVSLPDASASVRNTFLFSYYPF